MDLSRRFAELLFVQCSTYTEMQVGVLLSGRGLPMAAACGNLGLSRPGTPGDGRRRAASAHERRAGVAYRYVRLERRGAVALLTMNNPATANAMDEDLGPELVAALEGLALDRQVGALVLTGAGPIFSGGGNIVKAQQYLEDHPGQGAAPVFEGYTKWVSRAVIALTGMPQPVVAAVNGAASGAGLAWILACDLAVAVPGARLVPGFLAVGLVPAAGTNLGLARLLGHLRASEMLMLNRVLSASEALDLGLLHRVVGPQELLPTALDLAGRLAQGPRQALALSKALLNRAARAGLHGQLEDERRAVMMAADQPDFARLAGRFVGKKN